MSSACWFCVSAELRSHESKQDYDHWASLCNILNHAGRIGLQEAFILFNMTVNDSLPQRLYDALKDYSFGESLGQRIDISPELQKSQKCLLYQ
jgi:hypothetical protein